MRAITFLEKLGSSVHYNKNINKMISKQTRNIKKIYRERNIDALKYEFSKDFSSSNNVVFANDIDVVHER